VTTKALTGLLAKPADFAVTLPTSAAERAFVYAFAALQWPWLLASLSGGSKADKQALLERVGLPSDALPNLGSWKADTYLLHRVVDMIEALRPTTVVELGSGATSLVIAKALAENGGGTLYSFDQHRPFVDEMGQWLADHGLSAHFQHAPLAQRDPLWPGVWYKLGDLPASIDLLLIDGPPWTVHPFVRGMAERLFDRIPVGGAVMLDDAARPGERHVARRWRKNWPDFTFTYEGAGTKGLLVGRRERSAG
jgi:predicted O-methyltransferase YrrM